MSNETIYNEEMQAEGTEVETTEVPATEKVVFTLNNGEEGSRAAFIREKFLEDNMSRKEISEKFDIDYRAVYGATQNLENSAASTPRGRSAATTLITVDADNKVVTQEEDGIYVNGELTELTEMPETLEVNRNEWIKEQVAAGTHRAEVAKALGLSYGVVYGLTKEAEGSRNVAMIEYGDKVITRSEYIRILAGEGKTKSDIAKELGVEYSVVWSALKKEKTDAEKFADLVAKIGAYAEKVEDAKKFAKIMDNLGKVTFPVVEEAVEATEEVTEEAVEATEETTEA